MVLAHVLSFSLLTLFYPFAVFGYALLEETRPRKWFWGLVINYTLALIFLRFTTQLNFGSYEYLRVLDSYYIGL